MVNIYFSTMLIGYDIYIQRKYTGPSGGNEILHSNRFVGFQYLYCQILNRKYEKRP